MQMNEVVPLDGLLTAHGMRVTSQRRFVLAVLRDRPTHHFSADEVYAEGQRSVVTLSRPTAYSALAELSRAGLAHAISGRGAVCYGFGAGDDHAHFLCTTCERLIDVEAADRRQAMRLANPSFVVEQQHVLFMGTCDRCVSSQP